MKSKNKYYLSGEFIGKYLTKREIECLQLFIKGHTMRSAADIMGISPRTVESYLGNMKTRLHIHSKAELVATVYEHGLLSDFN